MAICNWDALYNGPYYCSSYLVFFKEWDVIWVSKAGVSWYSGSVLVDQIPHKPLPEGCLQ